MKRNFKKKLALLLIVVILMPTVSALAESLPATLQGLSLIKGSAIGDTDADVIEELEACTSLTGGDVSSVSILKDYTSVTETIAKWTKAYSILGNNLDNQFYDEITDTQKTTVHTKISALMLADITAGKDVEETFATMDSIATTFGTDKYTIIKDGLDDTQEATLTASLKATLADTAYNDISTATTLDKLNTKITEWNNSETAVEGFIKNFDSTFEFELKTQLTDEQKANVEALVANSAATALTNATTAEEQDAALATVASIAVILGTDTNTIMSTADESNKDALKTALLGRMDVEIVTNDLLTATTADKLYEKLLYWDESPIEQLIKAIDPTYVYTLKDDFYPNLTEEYKAALDDKTSSLLMASIDVLVQAEATDEELDAVCAKAIEILELQGSDMKVFKDSIINTYCGGMSENSIDKKLQTIPTENGNVSAVVTGIMPVGCTVIVKALSEEESSHVHNDIIGLWPIGDDMPEKIYALDFEIELFHGIMWEPDSTLTIQVNDIEIMYGGFIGIYHVHEENGNAEVRYLTDYDGEEVLSGVDGEVTVVLDDEGADWDCTGKIIFNADKFSVFYIISYPKQVIVPAVNYTNAAPLVRRSAE